MKFQLRIMFSILMFIFRLSAEDNEQENDKEEELNRYEHQRLYKMVVRRPTASEITSAISDLKFYQDIQVERLQVFFYRYEHQRLYKMVVRRPTASEITSAISDLKFYQDIQVERLQVFFSSGPYSVDFIELLNTYRTLSYKPIKFSADEITTLTTVSDDHGSLNNKILTQIKFYRKIQEIQCTNYAILKAILPKIKYDIGSIINYVASVIDMSYRGRFVVSDWQWEIFIQLFVVDRPQAVELIFSRKNLWYFDEILRKSLKVCRKNKYLMKNYDYLLNMYITGELNLDFLDQIPTYWLLGIFLNIYNRKDPFYLDYHNEYLKLPIGTKCLWLNDFWMSTPHLFQDISGLSFDWDNTYRIFKKEMDFIEHQYHERKWSTKPSDYIQYFAILLDILKAKWYIYVWIHLVVYRNAGSKAQRDYDRLIVAINKRINFVYTDDRIFNDVLILLSEIYKPEDEKINETIQILSDEVNRILRSVTEPSYTYIEATIDNEFVERTTKEYEDSAFINNHVKRFEDFIDDTEYRMNERNLRFLLLYINGSKFTDYFFPNER